MGVELVGEDGWFTVDDLGLDSLNYFLREGYAKKNIKIAVLEVEDLSGKKEKPITPADFEALWALYPNRDGKKAAQRYFQSSVKTQEKLKQIKQALANYLQCKTVKEGFIKNGSTWFNNWQDWIVNPITKDVPVKTEWVKDPNCTLCDEFGYVHTVENGQTRTGNCGCLKKIVTPI